MSIYKGVRTQPPRLHSLPDTLPDEMLADLCESGGIHLDSIVDGLRRDMEKEHQERLFALEETRRFANIVAYGLQADKDSAAYRMASTLVEEFKQREDSPAAERVRQHEAVRARTKEMLAEMQGNIPDGDNTQGGDAP